MSAKHPSTLIVSFSVLSAILFFAVLSITAPKSEKPEVNSSNFNFSTPTSVAVDDSGNVYVLDQRGVKEFTSNGNLISTYPLPYHDLRPPDQIALDEATGYIYVADWSGDQILKFEMGSYTENSTIQTTQLVTSRANIGLLAMPMGVAVDHSGNVYLSDGGDSQIVKFDRFGRFVSSGGRMGWDKGYLNMPMDLAFDDSGNLYVCEVIGVQKYSPSGEFLMMISAYPPNYGMGDGQLDYASGVTVDHQGNVFVADSRNDRVQVFGPDGSFIIKWGSTGSQNGQFWLPSGIAVDNKGYVYVADCGNDRIQKFTSNGVFVTAWGIPKIQRIPLKNLETRHEGWPYDLR